MADNTMIQDLTSGNPMKQLLKFAFPLVLANLLQQLYNMADMVIVGQYVGTAGLSAASVGGELAFFFLVVALGFTGAGQIVISQHIGVGSRDKIKNTIGTMFTATFFIGLVCMLVLMLACDTLLEWVNIPPEAAAYGHDYTFVYACGTIPVFGYNAVSAALRGMGDSKRPFIFAAVASVTNVVLDLIFVGPLELGCFGAALATVISQALAFFLSMGYLYKKREQFGFDFKLKSFAVDTAELRAMGTMGLPLCVQNAVISFSMVYINSYINLYGVVASAASAVGNKITALATICTAAMNTAGNTIIGQSFGARKFRRVSETVGCVLVVGLVFCAVLSVVFALFPEQVFSLFDKDPQVQAMSHRYVLPCVIGLMGFAVRSAAFAFYSGIGFSNMALAMGILDGVVGRIGLSLLLGQVMELGVYGFWMGSALAGHLIGIAGFAYFFSGKWKKRKLLVE